VGVFSLFGKMSGKSAENMLHKIVIGEKLENLNIGKISIENHQSPEIRHNFPSKLFRHKHQMQKIKL
jgi:hypothetical protein